MLNINPSKLLKTVSVLLLGYTLQAGAGITTSATSRHLPYLVAKNKSLLINLDRNITQITVGNPEIADFTLMSPNQLLLRGRSEGRTNATLWDSNKHVAMVVDVEVVEEQVQSQNLRDLKKLLYEVMPDEKIEVLAAGSCILLKGEISNLVKMDYAMKIAQGFTSPPGKGGYASSTGTSGSSSNSGEGNTQINVNSGVGSSGVAGSNGGGGCGDRAGGSGGGGGNTSQNIINMMHVGGEQQVMLEVKIAEVSRNLARLLRLDSGANKTSQANGSFIWSVAAGAAGAFTGAYVAGDTLFHWSLDFSRNTDLATILAEPNLTTLSGKKASFLSGGEFPYSACPPPSGNTSVGVVCTVNFKPFGVGLEFTPVILDSNRINLTTHVSVSSLSNKANEIVSAGLQTTSSIFGNEPTLNLQPVPSLDIRESVNTLELADGQTMSIAGLISSNQSNKQEQTPGLADIPVLGALFRNRESSSQKKELVILITPHLAKPIPHDQIKLPTDYYVAPDDIEFYLLGRMEARKKPVNTAQAPVFDPMSGGTTGQFGHQINDGDSK